MYYQTHHTLLYIIDVLPIFLYYKHIRCITSTLLYYHRHVMYVVCYYLAQMLHISHVSL